MKVKVFIGLFLGFGLVSCSPEWQMARLIKHHPEVLKSIETKVHDTFTVVKNVPIPEEHKDTVFNDSANNVLVDSGRLEIRYIHDTIHHVIRLKGKCKDSVLRVKIPVDRVVTVQAKAVAGEKHTWWDFVMMFLAGLGVACVIMAVRWCFKEANTIRHY